MPNRSDKLLAALNQGPQPQTAQSPRLPRVLQPATLYPYSEQVELPPEAAELPDDVQDMARQFISAKRRIGRELLAAAQLITEARAQIAHGQWLIFLRITNTSPDVGEYLQTIWHRATAHPAFRDAVERGWLSEGAARRMARESVPDDAIDAILQLPEPPTVHVIEQKLRELRSTLPNTSARTTIHEQMPTRVGISTPSEHEDTGANRIELLTEDERVTLRLLREKIACYCQVPVDVNQEDVELLKQLTKDLAVFLQVAVHALGD